MSALSFSSKRGKTLAGMGLVLVGTLSAPGEARATLGEDVASIDRDEEHLGAARGTRQIEKLAAGGGERHEITLPSGIVVREYVSPNGTVYAVSWRGPAMPNLRELLGTYFAQLAGHAGHGGHHRLVFSGTDLIVQSSGHRGSFAGRAWVPSRVPAGVDVDALRE